jgi:hypothetical protein
LLAKLSQLGSRSYWRRALSHHLKRQLFFPNKNSETLLGKPSPTGLESSPTLLAKHAFPVVTQTHEWVLYLDLIVGVSLTVVKVSSMRSGASGH